MMHGVFCRVKCISIKQSNLKTEQLHSKASELSPARIFLKYETKKSNFRTFLGRGEKTFIEVNEDCPRSGFAVGRKPSNGCFGVF